jgi:hypothetical protein
MVSGFIFVVLPCGFDVLPLCLVWWGDGFLGEFLLFFCLFYKSLDCFKVSGCVFVLKCGSFFASRSAVSLTCTPTWGDPLKIIYLLFLTAIVLTPVGSSTVHTTSTQNTEIGTHNILLGSDAIHAGSSKRQYSIIKLDSIIRTTPDRCWHTHNS